MHKVLGLLVAATVAGAPAHAGVYMGGGGPKLGSMVLPGKYPIAFPTRVDGNHSNCAGNGDKIPGQDLNNHDCVDRIGGDQGSGDVILPTVEQVGFDLSIGGQGVYYADKSVRIGGMGQLGFGKGFSDAQILGVYDQVLKQSQVDFYVGAGIGVGQYTFRGDGDERLRVPYYPARGHAGFQIRQKGQYAFGGVAYAQYAIPGNHIYTAANGNEFDDVSAPASYLTLGIEAFMMFGDFKPPKKKKKNKKKGKG